MNIKKRNNILENDISINNIPKEIVDILVGRGYDSEEKLNKFLNPSSKDMYNPFLFKDMEKAITRIKKAIENKEQIIIYGDYDVDGTCATSIMAMELRRIKGNVNCYIPNRHNEGYGLNIKAIDKIKTEKNPSLLITVDCGITNIEQVDYLNSLGIDVIVTDHHEQSEQLPNALAIINPKVKGETYPFKELCGAGIAGKVVEALSGKENMFQYVDLMALATVADVVPLIDENRIIVYGGLKLMNKKPRPGIEALSEYAKSKDENITSYHLGFRYGPMLNASGRINDASNNVRLLTCENIEKAKQYALEMYNYNLLRQEIEKNVLEECSKKIQENKPKGIILFGEDWEQGVIGIVASRVTDKYNCPVLIFTKKKGESIYHGSGRSIESIDLHSILAKCSDCFKKWGGHKMAAGMTLEEDKKNIFEEKFMAEVSLIDDSNFVKNIYYDNEIKANKISKELIESLNKIEPCGMSNPKPNFMIENACIKNILIIGKEKEHFSCNIIDDSGKVQGICFRQDPPVQRDNINIIFNPNINTFNDQETIQCQISDIHNTNIKYVNESDIIYGTRTIDKPLEIINIPANKIKQLNKCNINTVGELIDFFPNKYYDFRIPKSVEELKDKEMCAIIGTVKKVKDTGRMVYAMCVDDKEESFMVCWFNQSYVYRMLDVNRKYIFCGTSKITDTGFKQMFPKYFSNDINRYKTLIPIYKKVPGMSQDYLMDSIKKGIDELAKVDYLTEDIVKDFNLVSEYSAVLKLQSPKNDVDIEQGQRRQVFDRLFKFSLNLNKNNNSEKIKSDFIIKNYSMVDRLKSKFKYQLTSDQNKVISECIEVMKSGERLEGLIQGDVGSGKTIVSFMFMAIAKENGYQACLVAPTEVLAKQHYQEFKELCEDIDINVGYLSGSLKVREKREMHQKINSGEVDVVIGTHALLQESVEFKKLGIVCIDEQHRFGVAQRDKLLNRENVPHIVSMSATPIPRTLSMALYGSYVKVFNIKEKPMGRKDIITLKINNDAETNKFILEEIKKGRQCYIVCPLIEDSDADSMSEVTSIKTEVENIKKFFKKEPIVKISDVSGKMKATEVQSEISKFETGETNVLIATTIIEVGVNIPNATIMVIKNSERFGLAQAHQLRGRVGRGNEQSYCILQTSKNDPKADILCSTNDGFEIATEDLMLRGPGDYIGTQQTGNNQEVMLMISEPDLFSKILKLTLDIVNDNSLCSRFKYLIEE